MVEESILRKIKKALALAGNDPNQQEAETALLKAQEMMAKYNLSMGDVEEKERKKEVLNDQVTPYGRTPYWKKRLAHIIGENFRVQSFTWTLNGKSCIKFLGLQEDVELAKEMFEFACDSLEHLVRIYVAEAKREWFEKPVWGRGQFDNTGIKNDYISGFLNGLSAKFKEQVSKNGWGLVLVKDALVVQEVEKLNLRNASSGKNVKRSRSSDAYNRGYEQGKNLDNKIRIGD